MASPLGHRKVNIFLKIEQQANTVCSYKQIMTLENVVFIQDSFLSMFLSKLVTTRVFKIMILKMKIKRKFLNLCGLITESFLEIWPSQYKFLIRKKLMYMVPLWLSPHLMLRYWGAQPPCQLFTVIFFLGLQTSICFVSDVLSCHLLLFNTWHRRHVYCNVHAQYHWF